MISQVKLAGFYLTYEELKLSTFGDKSAYVGRFYLTYEELKQQMYTGGPHEISAFYLTYEELKRNYISSDSSSYNILSYL